MQTPPNPFKQALIEKRPQIGFWMGLCSPITAEIAAGAGFDWLLIDGEHSPNDIQSVFSQAQAIAAYPGTHAVARIPMGHGNIGQQLIKQYLDLGVQTLLVPMVDTPEQAQEIVRSMRYPPEGIRGIGGARGSRWGRYTDYPKAANGQVCLLVQVESREGLKNLEAIAAVEGVDGVFIGPGDLSASFGHIGNLTHPEMQTLIDDAIVRIVKTGKAPGILTQDLALSKKYLELGALFVAVGTDHQVLWRGAAQLAAHFKPGVAQ